MRIFFGKINADKDTLGQLAGGFYQAENGGQWFNGIETGDYAFMISSLGIGLWKAMAWSEHEGNTRLEFKIIIPDIGIDTKRLVALKFFMVNATLVIFTTRQTPKKGFFQLQLAQDFPETAIEDPATYRDTSNFRKIAFYPTEIFEDNSSDVKLFRLTNGQLGIRAEVFLDPAISGKFRDNTPHLGGGRINKDKVLERFRNLQKVATFSSDSLGLRQLYDAFCADYNARSIEEPDPGEESEEPELDLSLNDEMRDLLRLLRAKKQVILQGAPGVGKTYTTKELALRILGETHLKDREQINKKYQEAVANHLIAFCTFHQSMDYEDFVEGYKPRETETEVPDFALRLGVFRVICDHCRSADLSLDFDTAYAQFLLAIDEGTAPLELETPIQKRKFTYSVNERGSIVVRPRTEKSTPMNITKDMIRNYLVDGTIKDWKPYTTALGDYLRTQYQLPGTKSSVARKNHVLIIDEINRGNVSKIFGELITLLETDKREAEPGALAETLSVSLTYSQKPFEVPYNLYIVATMNTADRSLGQLDYALRRRFAFYPLKASRETLETYYANKAPLLGAKALDLFDQVKGLFIPGQTLCRDFDAEDVMIGHSYFMAETEEALQFKARFELEPILEEYRKDGILTCEKEHPDYQAVVSSIHA